MLCRRRSTRRATCALHSAAAARVRVGRVPALGPTKVPHTMREPNARRCLLALFEAAMGVPIHAAWAVPYVEEIHKASVENLNARRRESLHATCAKSSDRHRSRASKRAQC